MVRSQKVARSIGKVMPLLKARRPRGCTFITRESMVRKMFFFCDLGKL